MAWEGFCAHSSISAQCVFSPHTSRRCEKKRNETLESADKRELAWQRLPPLPLREGPDRAPSIREIRSMESIEPAASNRSSAQLEFERGHAKLREGDLQAALECLQKAHEVDPDHARVRSYLGLCLALCERRFDRAVELCASATKQEFFNPELYLNLARVHLAFGFKNEGHRYLLRGQMIDPANEEIRTALDNLGDRTLPVLSFLPRRHILNRWLGTARHVIGRRDRVDIAA